jgi:hypothetical protein
MSIPRPAHVSAAASVARPAISSLREGPAGSVSSPLSRGARKPGVWRSVPKAMLVAAMRWIATLPLMSSSVSMRKAVSPSSKRLRSGAAASVTAIPSTAISPRNGANRRFSTSLCASKVRVRSSSAASSRRRSLKRTVNTRPPARITSTIARRPIRRSPLFLRICFRMRARRARSSLEISSRISSRSSSWRENISSTKDRSRSRWIRRRTFRANFFGAIGLR